MTRVNYTNENGLAVFTLEHSEGNLLPKIADFMMNSQGYSMHSKTTDKALVVYKGSYALRLFLGAFSKYYRFIIFPRTSADGHLQFCLQKDSSGFSGGIIGINQVNKELDRLVRDLYNFLETL